MGPLVVSSAPVYCFLEFGSYLFLEVSYNSLVFYILYITIFICLVKVPSKIIFFFWFFFCSMSLYCAPIPPCRPPYCSTVTHKSDTAMSHTCCFRSLVKPPPLPPRAALLANRLPGQLMKTTIGLCCCPAGHQYATVSISHLAYIMKP